MGCGKWAQFTEKMLMIGILTLAWNSFHGTTFDISCILFFSFDLFGVRYIFQILCISSISGQVITGSWDKTLKCWDPRGASGEDRTLVGTYPQPERVYSLSLVGNRLVVATAGRHVNIYDLRNMSQPEQRRESSLKYQTRCVRCYPNGTGMYLLLSCRFLESYFTISQSSCTCRC